MNLEQISISRYMSSCPYTIEHDESMEQAHRRMRTKRVRHLPVMRDGKLVGVVSAGDLHLLETLDGIEPEKVQVSEAMTPEPYCVPPETPLEPVVAVMAANKYGCAVVVQDGSVVGIFTTIDALIAFSDVLRSS